MFASQRRSGKVKQWDGDSGSTSSWDGLRRDARLWFPDGDCLVHLYTKGHSRRGPSFLIPSRLLQQAQCDHLVASCLIPISPPDSASSSSDESTETPSSENSFFRDSRRQGMQELYIPAPDACPREEAFSYHITTRNFFAWLCGEPLVGTHLGKSLVDLLERMDIYRSNADNSRDVVSYAENVGYAKLAHSPDYALAMLYFAEHCQIADMYTDAFAHCVGMNDVLSTSQEFDPISKVSKALITRAYLEMDLHLGRVSKALHNFLEDDLSSAYFGLSQGARVHLDRFRSFLHAFYVEKFGYWPPPKESAYPRAVYRAMYFEFRNLYDHLVDPESTYSIQSQKPAAGGICVLQNINTFNERHKYAPLPHPLPLIPSVGPHARGHSQRALLAFRLGKQTTRNARGLDTMSALTAATNAGDPTLAHCPLVRAYMQFESDWSIKQEEKVSIADARRVRWILIYGILQMLISVTRAPKEVRDADTVSYPLCCLLAGTPPWKAGLRSIKERPKPTIPNIPRAEICSSPTFDIQPDCEVVDYFNLHNRRASNVSTETKTPAAVKGSRSVRRSRTHSVQSSGSPRTTESVRSSAYGTPVLASASLRSIRQLRATTQLGCNTPLKAPIPMRPQSFCDILGYGSRSDSLDLTHRNAIQAERARRRSIAFDFTPRSDEMRTTKAVPDLSKLASLRSKNRPKRLELSALPINDYYRSPTLQTFQLDLADQLPAAKTAASLSSPTALPASATSSRVSSGSLNASPWSSDESSGSDADGEDGSLPEMDHASLYSRGDDLTPKNNLPASPSKDGSDTTIIVYPVTPTPAPVLTDTSRRVSFSAPFSPFRTASQQNTPLLTTPMPKGTRRSSGTAQHLKTFWLEEPDLDFFSASQDAAHIGRAIGHDGDWKGAGLAGPSLAQPTDEEEEEDDGPKTLWGVDMWGALDALKV